MLRAEQLVKEPPLNMDTVDERAAKVNELEDRLSTIIEHLKVIEKSISGVTSYLSSIQ